MNTRMTENKIVLVKRKTRLQELIVRYNTVQQARFYIERLGADFNDYVEEDQQYQRTLEQATTELQQWGRLQILDREHVPSFIFGPGDQVVVLGQDGLVANTMKYATGLPLIGVNPDPKRWDGVLLPFTIKDLGKIVQDVFAQRRQFKEVRLACAELNDGQTLYGVNDLFIGRKTHVSARYQLHLGAQWEQQSSSGIIVSTGMGSTGWMKSVLTGAAAIARSSDQQVELFSPETFGWDSPYLYFSVREPFPSRTTSANIVFGRIDQQPLRIISQMPENGVIFSDGMESDYLEFNSGVEASIYIAQQKAHLVV